MRRVLGCSLMEAQLLALKEKKFIVYYIEEANPYDAKLETPSLETALFRNALSQNELQGSQSLEYNIEFNRFRRFNLTDMLNSQVFTISHFIFIKDSL